jgi:hypothetical protein
LVSFLYRLLQKESRDQIGQKEALSEQEASFILHIRDLIVWELRLGYLHDTQGAEEEGGKGM